MILVGLTALSVTLYRPAGVSSPAWPTAIGYVLTSRRSFMSAHPNLTFRAVRAFVRGVHFFRTRREETVKILGKFFRTSEREALDETWEFYSPVMLPKPYVSESAVQAVLNHLAETELLLIRFLKR